MNKQSINLIVALEAEALPLIEFFGLKQLQSNGHMNLYAKERLNLVVSGIGKESAANAVDWIHTELPDQNKAWLNVGIAGHGALDVGDGFLANRITDEAIEKSWYPVFTFVHHGRSGPLTTVDDVETEYPHPVGYDMEASGYFIAANRISTAEMVHSYKVVSDNPQASVLTITPAMVSEIIEDNLNEIRDIVDELDKLVSHVTQRHSLQENIGPFLGRWKFSVTQVHQLKKLLQKSKVLGYEVNIESDSLRNCQNARAVIKVLNHCLNSHWLDSGASNV